MDQWHTIRHLHAVGWSQRRIATQLGVSRNTVAAALAGETPPRYQREGPPSPLDPWLATMEAGARRGLRGSRVLAELRAAGYTGSRAAFYTRWAAVVEAQREPTAACRFETDPGEQAQFDWAEYSLSVGGLAQRVYVYSLLLGYSRRVHWFPSLAVDQPAVFEALEVGLRHFGGACRFLVLDNPRVFVDRHRGSDLRWNPHFQRFAGYYRFAPIACTPRNPQAKGKVENPFAHLEELFLRARAWRDWGHFQGELAAFEAQWEQRVHGTTKVPPVQRFRVEQPTLLPLPAAPFWGLCETFRQVSNDCLLSFQGVRYSVWWRYAGQQVLVRPSQGRVLEVYAPSGTLLTRHLLRPSGSPPVIVAAHYEGLRSRHRAALHGLTGEFRERYGAHGVAETFLQRLLVQHRHHPERTLAQVLELLAGAPSSLAVAALAAAVECNLCAPRFLAERLRQATQAADTEAAPPSPIPPVGQVALPCLDIERPLASYGRALDPAGKEPA